MKYYSILAFLFFVSFHATYAQQQKTVTDQWRPLVEQVLSDTSVFCFNGIVLIAQQNKPVMKMQGYADMEQKIRVNANSQFVIGSISKQITAVLVLREYEKHNLQLHVPIRTYLPELKMSWADTVTIHHLLTHMHGIQSIDEPLAFIPGTQFDYGLSNAGYRLLSEIVERVSGKSFAQISKELFKQCGMKETFHPDDKRYKHLVKGYTEQEGGTLVFETESFQNAPAAGGFVSTAGDMLLWNQCLHGGKLLLPETYQLMISKKKGAIRQHRLWGEVYYGYGITVDDQSVLQLGQTGFAPGFVSMNYYFPATHTSVIMLENTAYRTSDLKRTFYHHVLLLNEVRKRLSK
jgi:CubicO group peptidase (beta-lactamase class C family)